MSTAELCRVTRRTSSLVQQLRALVKHGDDVLDVGSELRELETAVATLIDEVQLRELTRWRLPKGDREAAARDAAPSSTSGRHGVPVHHLGLQAART